MNKFWEYFGIGVMVFLILMGIGSCFKLAENNDTPLIRIETQK